jgi:hypothetical protein
MDLHPWNFYEFKTGEARPWTPEILALLEGALEAAPEHPMANHLYIRVGQYNEASKANQAAVEADQQNYDEPPSWHMSTRHVLGALYLQAKKPKHSMLKGNVPRPPRSGPSSSRPGRTPTWS